MKTEILLHIPHSSYIIPKEYKKLFCISEKELRQEQIKMTDSYTNELFNLPFKKLVFPISRLICDVERFRDEKDEEMTKQGMWVCYEKTHTLKKLKVVTKEHKQEILEKYYDKHHQNFEKEVENILKKNKNCLIIDCHSFPSKALPYEIYQQDERPNICIGTDEYHTNKELVKYLKNNFEKLGYSVGINTPFKGAIVPLKFYKKEKRIQSIMIEINRKLYMNEETGERNENFKKLKKDIKRIIKSTLQ